VQTTGDNGKGAPDDTSWPFTGRDDDLETNHGLDNSPMSQTIRSEIVPRPPWQPKKSTRPWLSGRRGPWGGHVACCGADRMAVC
jgi:hypothetical protein